MPSPPNPSQSSRPVEFSSALRACRGAFVGIGLISAVLNVLFLTGAFFMLGVYDRVLPSRSLPTLVALALLAFGLYLFQAVLDVLRGRVLVRIGSRLDEALSGRIYGPSAAGKSCLVRGIVGVWSPARGKVRLDGAALEH